jgi:hypothetical protein
MDSIKHRESRGRLTLMTILYVISLLGWPHGLGATVMALGDNAEFGRWVSAVPGGMFPLWATFAYPILVIGGLIAAWVLHTKGRYTAAFWCAMLPIIDFVLGVLTLLLLTRTFFGHF